MITITVTPAARKLCEEHAEIATLKHGGDNFVRERTLDERATDQLVGLLGHWAFCYWKDGDEFAFVAHRDACNQTWWEGDGGSDVLGSNIEIKTSLMRNPGLPLEAYRLPVRGPQPGLVYVLALLPAELDRVFLMGWARGIDLVRAGVQAKGTFKGSNTLPVRRLQPLPPFQWT